MKFSLSLKHELSQHTTRENSMPTDTKYIEAKLADTAARLENANAQVAALHAELGRPIYRIARLQKNLASKIPGLTYALKASYRSARRLRNKVRKTSSLRSDPVSQFLGTLAASNCVSYHNAEKWYTTESPEVSIIILNWNKGTLTAQCLHEIWKHTADVSYEIVVLDNGSDPFDLYSLSALPGPFRLIRLSINRLFGEGNNIAAEAAQGKYLLFLNNDAFVTQGWLPPLVNTMQQPSVGAAGPMFVYPDGKLQECGSFIDFNGDPKQRGKGIDNLIEPLMSPQSVHYISAACLLIRRQLFDWLDGFSLDFEPAYYEDVDLCFRMRKAGYAVHYIPDTKIVHIENYSHREIGDAMKHSIALNRQRFINRHKDIVGRDVADYQPATIKSIPSAVQRKNIGTVGLYTPFSITPGGGERYLFSMASALSLSHDVVLITPDKYSFSRLRQMGKHFGLDLSGILMESWDEALSRSYDFFVSMGNSIVPDVPALTPKSFYLCQFPFPCLAPDIISRMRRLDGYQGYLTYSNYSKIHIQRVSEQSRLPQKSINIISPPCPIPVVHIDKPSDRAIILSVGRFFQGGHCKNHHILVQAFRKLLKTTHRRVELHIAGSVHANQESLNYFNEVRRLADGLPVTLHPNIDADKLTTLYGQSHIYWHGTGMDQDPDIHPEKMEHFGISIVEAMGAGCIPLAFAAGGPTEIITDGYNGFLYNSEDTLVERTAELLLADEKNLASMRALAKARATDFSISHFSDAVIRLVGGENHE